MGSHSNPISLKFSTVVVISVKAFGITCSCYMQEVYPALLEVMHWLQSENWNLFIDTFLSVSQLHLW